MMALQGQCLARNLCAAILASPVPRMPHEYFELAPSIVALIRRCGKVHRGLLSSEDQVSLLSYLVLLTMDTPTRGL